MDSPDGRVILEKTADLVPETDTKRRRLLTNYDKLAQAALDAERAYVNKHGESASYPQPDFAAAIKAMEKAQSLLGLEEKPAEQPGEKGESAQVRAIREVAAKATGT